MGYLLRLCTVLAIFVGCPSQGKAASVGPDLSYDVAGLAKPVDIMIDPWGVPHAFAGTIEDAFFAQGFMTAKDRLWQIDFAHRRRLGRLAAVLGPAFVPFDQAARLFLDRRDPDVIWAAVGPQIHGITRAYVAGINAFIAATVTQPDLLPPQYALVGYSPEPWDADDMVRIQQLGGSDAIDRQFRRAGMACRGQLPADALRAPLEPAWTIELPTGLDPCDVTAADRELFAQLSAPLPLRPDSIWIPPTQTPAQHGTLGIPFDGTHDGSNAWVIAPKLSATGRPVLANDPHLSIGIPSERYIVHLDAPGLAIAGGSAPGLPGVANGHNGRVAFGRTDFNLSRDDIYVLETNPDDPSSYRHGNSWERFETVFEDIPVKGAAPVRVTLTYSSLGPVIAAHPERHRALAVRASWMIEPGAPLLSQLPYNMAGDWTSFNQALRNFQFGSSFMYADIEGNIGWRPAGWVPLRPHHDGLLPVPGDGRYDWQGLTPLELLPSDFNPSAGWIANANQMSLPLDYPAAERKLGFDWQPADRYRRIVEVLQAAKHVTLADSIALQHDTVSERARRIVPLLENVRSERPQVEAARARLLAWDRHIDADSPAATLFEAWWLLLGPMATKQLVPSSAGIGVADSRILIPALEKPDARFGLDPAAGRNAVLVAALDAAVTKLERSMGSDQSIWSWGRLHTVDLSPALASLMDPKARAQASIEGGGSGGDNATVMARWFDNDAHPVVSGGAAYSMVLDVGDWDNSVELNSPGQSGDPRSPHYRDLYQRWLNGEMIPMLFSRANVEAVAEQRIRLSPR